VVTAGTRVTLSANEEISGNSVKVGDPVHFVASLPVVINGVAVIAVGAPARGKVVRAKHSSPFGHAGELQISVDEILAVDGSILKLRATAFPEEHSALSVTQDGGSPSGFIQGQDAKIPVGKIFSAYVNADKIVKGSSMTYGLPTQPSIGYPTFPTTPSLEPVVIGTAPPRQQHPVVTPLPPAPPVHKGSSIVNVMLCQDVTPDGVPLSTGEKFSARIPSVAVWFAVEPSREDRTFEIRWYRGRQRFYTSSAIVRSFRNSAYATLISPGSAGFTPGTWNVVILAKGQVQVSKKLVFTR
jgi:hypothetical protein